jgi:phosphatidylserine decarboxylase
VAVGALLVGSIGWTVSEGTKVRKGDELGYFAYGGSTVILLFPEEMRIEFDQDMRNWSNDGFETVLQVGQGVARSRQS